MRLVFIGTGEIGVPTLQALEKSRHEVVAIVTQPDKPAGRDQKLTPPPIKMISLGTTIPILQPKRIKEPESIEQLRFLAPDVVVVMAYGQILPRAVLEIPKRACLNLHASLLPRWRGAAPVQAAIAAGDQETGITVMYMDEGLDTGDILLERKTPIAANETGGSLHDRLGRIAPSALLDSLDLLENGNAPRAAQDNQAATIAPKLKREDGRIDWNETAGSIERKIRAYNPWPGAFSDLVGRNLKIFSASIVDQHGRAGEILRKDSDLIVGTADRAISLQEVQLEGKRRMSAAEFLRGHNW